MTTLLKLTLLMFCTQVLAARPIRGSYDVPVSDELRTFASFDVKFKSEEYERDPVQITFPLPVELTGIQNSISMKKSATDPRVWSGPLVDATCDKEGRYFVCQMQFSGLKLDELRAQELITRRNPDPAVADGIIQVSRRFGGEGIGILRYKLRGGDRP
jgi:hypothetical protein